MTDAELTAALPVKKDLRQRYLDGEDLTLEEEREVTMSIRQGYAASNAAATKARTTRITGKAKTSANREEQQKLGKAVLDLI